MDHGAKWDHGANCYRRFLNGDDSGMVEIIDIYKDGLILYLNGFAGNIQTAEEWMEEVFVKLVIKKPHFRGKCSFKTWLYTIGRNVALDALRRSLKLPEVSMEDSLIDSADEGENLEQAYLRQERKIVVHRALRKIKSEYRQVLYLLFFEQFDNGEIAQIMKKSKRQIENLIYRAKMSLKSELEREGFIYEEY